MNNLSWSVNRIFWCFIAAHLVIWTAVPGFVNHNLPIDIIEGLAWGNEGQWGYHKHPPLSPWLMNLFAIVSGSADWAQYLLSQLSVCIAFIAMWKLAGNYLSPLKALISVLLLEGIYYHGYSSPEFNANVILLPLWSIAIYAFYRAVQGGKTRWWVILGTAAALGILGKYFTGFLLISMFGYLVATKQGRQQFLTSGPYVALATLIVLLIPHVVWMIETDFATLGYGINRAAGAINVPLSKHLIYPFKFLISQLILLLPLLFMLLTFGFRREAEQTTAEKTNLLLFVSLGPLLLIMLLSAVMGWKLRTMWGTPLFLTSGLALVYFLKTRVDIARLAKFRAVFLFFALLGPMLYIGVYGARPYFKEDGKRTQFPGREIAEAMSREWQALYPNQPVAYVIGDVWRAGNVAYYLTAGNRQNSGLPDKRAASVFIDADPQKSSWIDPDQVAARGGLIIWKAMVGSTSADPLLALYQQRYPYMKFMPPLQMPLDLWGKKRMTTVSWGILPPR